MTAQQVREPQLVLATANPHKLTELARILEASRVEVCAELACRVSWRS